MKVLITGAGGQLGRDLLVAFHGDDVVGLPRAELDVSNRDQVLAAMSDYVPDLVVNAAAYTKVDDCEADPELAWRVNSGGSWWIAEACSRIGARMLHLSTDYVFDGTADRPYTEFDATNPQSVYGRTKVAAERLIQDTLDAHWIVRTSWLHGAHGHNFVKTMLRLGRERDRLRVVADQVASPTFTADLAPAVKRLAYDDVPYGTYHLTNSGHCTWHQLAEAVFEIAGMRVAVDATDTASWGAPAPRPANSVLDNRKAQLLGIPALPPWHDSLHRLLRDLEVAA